jgi:hypothetical protein
MTLKTVNLEDGKYTILHDEGHGGLTALRNGEVWRNMTGDGMVLAMFQEIEDLKRRIEENKGLAAEKLDELSRAISVRKVETSVICYNEKLPKPDFQDLDWMFEQIFWLKKTL